MMRLVFSPKASLDLEEIGDYIAKDNPARALSFLGEIETHCHKMADMPTAFPKRDDLSPGLRMAVHGNYLIFFRIQDDTVRIERIVHGSRQLHELL
jgi:toxin ParE1/3/4